MAGNHQSRGALLLCAVTALVVPAAFAKQADAPIGTWKATYSGGEATLTITASNASAGTAAINRVKDAGLRNLGLTNCKSAVGWIAATFTGFGGVSLGGCLVQQSRLNSSGYL